MNQNLSELRQQVMELGIDLSSKQQQTAISSRRAGAREAALAGATTAQPSSDQLMHAIERAIIGTGNTLTLLLMLLLSNIALPVGIVGLAVVEMQRVGDGISLFDANHAGLMAVVAVSFYMVLLVVKAHMQINATGTLEKSVWSLRLFRRSVSYRLGTGAQWSEQKTTGLERIEATIKSVAWVIIILGTVGSMKVKLASVGGAWYQALIMMATESTLTDFLTYLGGFIFTAALLAATHWGVGYAYERYARLRPDVRADADTSAHEDAAEAQYLQFMIAKLEQKRSSEKAEQPATNPFGNTRPVPVVREYTPTMQSSNGHSTGGATQS